MGLEVLESLRMINNFFNEFDRASKIFFDVTKLIFFNDVEITIFLSRNVSGG